MKAWSHFCTITKHKILVGRYCFRVGLYRQGLLHDMSKYSPTEFLAGCRYYQGVRSPNNAQREQEGYSAAWLHHKGRNRHHFEYWLDYGTHGEKGMVGILMPRRYVVEMFVDRIAACRIYQGNQYRSTDPLTYYQKGRDYMTIHKESEKLLEELLTRLAEEGEEQVFRYIREVVLASSEWSRHYDQLYFQYDK